jgi:hypothetical protein
MGTVMDTDRWEIDPNFRAEIQTPSRLEGETSPCCGVGILLLPVNVAPRSPDPKVTWTNMPVMRELPCCERCATVLRRKVPDEATA